MWLEEEYMLRVLRLNLNKIKATGLLSSHLKGGGCINTHTLHIHVCLKVQHLCFWKIRIDFKNCASTFIWKKGKQMKIKPTELYHERTQEGWRSKCFYFGAMCECHGSETNEIIHSSLFKFRELGQSQSGGLVNRITELDEQRYIFTWSLQNKVNRRWDVKLMYFSSYGRILMLSLQSKRLQKMLFFTLEADTLQTVFNFALSAISSGQSRSVIRKLPGSTQDKAWILIC